MRAVVHHRYGPPEVLHLEDVEPPAPDDDQILVRVHASTVTRGDCHHRSARPFVTRFLNPLLHHGGVLRPTRLILGGEFAGVVEATGAGVTEFAAGDRVFGTSLFGANAELVCVRAGGPVAPMPAGMGFEEAAAVPDGGILALGCLERAGLRSGQSVLVYGASGSIGTAAVQLAKHFGAQVTAVCSTPNLELARSLGADETIDYLHDDFTKNGERYDIVFDAVGKKTFGQCRNSLTEHGKYVPTDGFANLFWLLWTSRVGTRKVAVDLPPRYRRQEVVFLKELIEAGEYRAVVDRVYPLEDAVEATRYVETGQKVGNVVLTVAS